MASGLLILPKKQFFLYSVFGSVDLKIFGHYELKGRELYFSPDSSTFEAYKVYGSNDASNDDSLQLYYHKPQDWDSEILGLELADDVIFFPEFDTDEPVSITITKPQDNRVTLIYADPEYNGYDAFLSIPISQETTTVRIIHNYYAPLVKELVAKQYRYQDSAIVDENQIETKQKILSAAEMEKATSLLELERNKSKTIIYKGQVFKALNVSRPQ